MHKAYWIALIAGMFAGVTVMVVSGPLFLYGLTAFLLAAYLTVGIYIAEKITKAELIQNRILHQHILQT